jgi:4-hydroxy-tetrahydrodipicolinate synthase
MFSNLMRNKFSGTGVAMVTPFKKDKFVDFEALEKLTGHLINGGVDFLVVLGTTGEAATQDRDERKEVFQFIAQTVDGKVPLVAGFGGNNTSRLIKDIESFHFRGYDAILSASPHYNKPSQEGIYLHYKVVADNSPVPVILYNVPGRTASNVTAQPALKLAEHENVIGIKEASGDLNQCMEIVQHKPKDWLVLSGEDLLTLPMIGFGMDGVISVIGNAYPRQFSDMVRLALDDKFNDARQLHFQLKNLMEMIFEEGNPAGVKCLLHQLGICEEYMRMPLVPVSDALRNRMEVALRVV